MEGNWDFCGWATRNNLRCSDGRIIRQNAFADDDGKEVPIVWMHQYDSINNVLGHAILCNKPEGVYTYGKFNNSPDGQQAKLRVQNGDIKSLSIYANQLVHDSDKGVRHGVIRELSLVLAGANPGAYIENVSLKHGEDSEDFDEGIIYTDDQIELYHADTQKNDGTESKKQDSEKEDTKMADKEKTVQDVFDTLSEEQKNVVYYMIGQALEYDKDNKDDEEDADVKHNVFDNDKDERTYLSHDAMESIFKDAKRVGSLRDAVLNHMDTDEGLDEALMHATAAYGVDNIEYLFPDSRTITTTPEFIKRDDGWVSIFMNGTRHSPFSRVKSLFADITEDAARAKGYMKGKLKKDEVFSLLKRSTDPQTIYKRQKLDRDDVIDIVDFDVVAWIKSEMRMMLNEEIARAALVGDGRMASDDDKINESHIRPIYKDEEFYTIRAEVAPVMNGSVVDTDATARAAIRAFIKKRKDYKGSGNLTMFVTEDFLSDMLLLEDEYGRSVYPDTQALARKLRVNRIVTTPVMEGQTADGKPLLAIAVDLKDYNFGADKGGSVAMFEDFDIDYNQQKYLIETRCSGALIRPYSAIVLEQTAASVGG